MNDPIEADETEIDIEPRSPTAIATRLLLVVSAARRAFLDADDDQSSRQQRDAERFDLANWLAAENLLAEATPD